jgi:hypothetical protein
VVTQKLWEQWSPDQIAGWLKPQVKAVIFATQKRPQIWSSIRCKATLQLQQSFLA